MTLIDTIVTTTDGLVGGRRGRRARRGTISWKGIPFAAPPVGRGRFREAEPVAAWPGVRDCTSFGNAAVQERRFTATGPGRYAPTSEDCLTLNVFSPDSQSSTPRPVMVFIHGGAYILGTAATPLYDGSALARAADVIVVTVQYRFGAFGLLDFSAYSTPERTFDENPGLSDMLAALRWVQRNIAAFGGDPDAVTVFGESAGGSAVLTLLATPDAEGLFARAIAESPAPELVVGKPSAEVFADEFLRLLREPERRSSDIADRGEPIAPEHARELLDGASTEEIFRASNRLMRFASRAQTPEPVPFAPVAGSRLLPHLPVDAAQAGKTHPVPLIVGGNRDEGKLFEKLWNMLPDAERMLLRVEDEGAREQISALYTGPGERLRLSADATFWAPALAFADGHSRVAPTYAYRYDFYTKVLGKLGVGATHATELFAVFGAYRSALGAPLSVGDWGATARVTADVQSRWGAFAHTGVPGDDWPRYSVDDRETLVIDRSDRIEADPDGERRLAWHRGVGLIAEPVGSATDGVGDPTPGSEFDAARGI